MHGWIAGWVASLRRALFVVVAFLCASVTFPVAAEKNERWVVYYGSAIPAEQFSSYDVIVFDREHHPSLDTLKDKITLGYISLGEAETYRGHFKELKKKKLLLSGNRLWKGHHVIDIRKAEWKHTVLESLVPTTLAQGFDGIMLDTIDTPLQLEIDNPKKYKGMRDAAADLITSIRARYPDIKIMFNRGFAVLPQVAGQIDMVMAETIYTDWQPGTKRPVVQPVKNYDTATALLAEAKRFSPILKVYTLDYWPAEDKQRVQSIYARQRQAGFIPYVTSSLDLQSVNEEPSSPIVFGQALPRVLVALYDAREESSPRTTQVHRFLEMPANYLGFDIHYYPVNDPLPKLGENVAGVVLWFNNGMEVPDASAYLSWLTEVQEAGKKILIVENPGIGETIRKNAQLIEQWNRVLKPIGLYDNNNWISLTYQARIVDKDPNMVGFERNLAPVLPDFNDTHAILKAGKSHLQLAIDKGEGESTYDLIVTGTGGGYIAEDYALFHIVQDNESRISQWIVNPFLFLSEALGVGIRPIPDATTLAGRRIFYSHIDGDGWNNISEINQYNQDKVMAAEVIEKEILKPYSDFAFNVGLITGDVDPECFAAPQSVRVAQDIFALPNVEPSSHTHSHPLFWRFFAQYTPEKEAPLLARYPSPPKHDFFNTLHKNADKKEAWDNPLVKAAVAEEIVPGKYDPSEVEVLAHDFPTPRSYACRPFNLDEEVSGSVARIEKLASGKPVKLLQWSGDTSPFAAALAKTREAGLYNINGGDSRFDSEYPSYSSVSPMGLNIGKERQIYSSNSNENTYTNLWTGRFFGFRYLQSTIANTEYPRRVKPINLYFHMYSGEKQASLNALKENMEYVRKQDVIPITTSNYAAVANGFYTADIIPEGADRWLVKNRGALQTVRFDNAGDQSVDIAGSRGVLGFRQINDSLYVALDPVIDAALITLSGYIDNQPPYLIESRWRIANLKMETQMLSFETSGYGAGVMRWQMPQAGSYNIKASKKGDNTPSFSQTITANQDGVLSFDIASISNGATLIITIVKDESHV